MALVLKGIFRTNLTSAAIKYIYPAKPTQPHNFAVWPARILKSPKTRPTQPCILSVKILKKFALNQQDQGYN